MRLPCILIVMLQSFGLVNSCLPDKLIVFMTSHKPFRYVAFSRIMAEGRVGMVVKSIVFSFHLYIPLLFTNPVSTFFCVSKMKQIFLSV